MMEKTPSYHSLSRTHYLSDEPVIRHDGATTKLRIVFDASAKVDGLPLRNDFLYAGPFLTS